jgi:beta-lactamase superfamily II metal-dependent hydrolase
MPIVHFLNVNSGDCSIIQHGSGRNTVIDVCNAKALTPLEQFYGLMQSSQAAIEKGINGNFNQKKYPVNPITYMKERGIDKVWRFIATHPDMDHLDGIQAFFNAFAPDNFWDTDNNCEKEWGDGNNGGFSEADWSFYKKLRDGRPTDNPKRLTLYAGDNGPFWNRDENGNAGADGITVLAPTRELVTNGNSCEEYNDSSYVLLYQTRSGNRILFAGDSHDATWEHILKNHGSDVKDIDVLIAPHHGRKSDRDWEFLDVVNPMLTFFGNAPAEHLAYSAWKNRDLGYITNNQAGSIILNAEVCPAEVYVTCNAFAKMVTAQATFDTTYKAYKVGTVKPRAMKAVAVPVYST